MSREPLKPIWVSDSVHRCVKAEASKKGQTIKKLMEETFGKETKEELRFNAKFKIF